MRRGYNSILNIIVPLIKNRFINIDEIIFLKITPANTNDRTAVATGDFILKNVTQKVTFSIAKVDGGKVFGADNV